MTTAGFGRAVLWAVLTTVGFWQAVHWAGLFAGFCELAVRLVDVTFFVS